MCMRLFALPLAAAFFPVSVELSATPATAQSAHFICSADENGRPANCVSTSGVPDPAPQPSDTPPPQPSYTPPPPPPPYKPPPPKRSSYTRTYHQQPHYQPPVYQQPYSAPAYYPTAYSPPVYYPQPQSSCCCPVSKRGLFTSLSFSFCNNDNAALQYPQYPAYVPQPQYSYYPQYSTYPQYSYYPQPEFQAQWTVGQRSYYRSRPPHARVYGPWTP